MKRIMMRRTVIRLLTTMLVAFIAVATAQLPLLGSYLENSIGFLVTFEQQLDGRVNGYLTGATGPTPLYITTDTHNAQGSFSLQGTASGFAAQLQPDQNTLLIWLFSLDAMGQAVPGSYEQYTAMRQQNSGSAPVQPGGAASQAGSVSSTLVGRWASNYQFQGMPLTIDVSFHPDGTYEEIIYTPYEAAGWWTGRWQLDASGRLQQTATAQSPQLCFMGQCSASPIAGTATGQLTFVSNDVFSYIPPPAPGQAPGMAYRYQRVTGLAGGVGPGVPGGHYPWSPPIGGVQDPGYMWNPPPSGWDSGWDSGWGSGFPDVGSGGPIDHDTFIREIIWEDYGDDDDEDDGW